MKKKMISLFTGAGGLDWGFHHSNNYDLVISNEILRPHLKTYSDNHKSSVIISGGVIQAGDKVRSDLRVRDSVGKAAGQIQVFRRVRVRREPCSDLKVLCDLMTPARTSREITKCAT